MFTIYWNPGAAFNNVACAKNCNCNWNFLVLLLLKSRNVAVKSGFSQAVSAFASASART